MANYEVNNKKMTIKAVIAKLTEEELRVVKNYTVLGYKLNPVETLEKANYSREAVEKYIEENGTKEQLEEFKKKCNEPVLDKDGNPKKYNKDTKNHKKDDIKTKGYINGLQWFKNEFEDYEKNN